MGEKRLTGRGGDLLLHMESSQKCLASGQITGKALAATFDMDNVVGMPLAASNIPAYQGDEADVVALIIEGRPISQLAAGASTTAIPPYTILNDFDGVVINQSAIKTTDPAGDAWTGGVAAVVAALVALGAKVVTEPTKYTSQTN